MIWTIKREIDGVFAAVDTFDDGLAPDSLDGAALATAKVNELTAQNGGCWAIESSHASDE